MDGVAVTALAALSAADAPCVWGTVVAVLTHHIGLAGALAAAPVTLAALGGGTRLLFRSKGRTHALWIEEGHTPGQLWSQSGHIRVPVLTCAALCGSVAIVTRFAVLAGVALSVVEAFEAGARSGVAGLGVVHVDVVVALTGHAAAPRNQRVSIVTRSALVTAAAWTRQTRSSVIYL